MDEKSEYNKIFTDEYSHDTLEQPSYDKVTSKKIKDAIGMILILLGLITAGWVFNTVYKIIHSPKDVPIYTSIANEISETQVKNGEKTMKIVLPPKATAITCTALMLFIVTIICCCLITQGVNLMHFDMLKLHRKLDAIKYHFNTKLNEINQSIKRS